ncbi:MAG: ABC transporter substrate-binding protein [Rhodocyclaceae bacterium]|nr:ABC transporter substrate-binding protein [Rhodocyclaceae bacterium]MBX3669326.1 ABC transporter substrate-binding protein [Rhodocyclaceae bacterium]
MLKRLLFCLALWVGLVPAVMSAQQLAPDELVRSVGNEVLSIVQKDPDLASGNRKKVLQLVETRVLPHFEFGHMTALAVGRDWRRATPDQQKQLTDEFRTLLVRTYSNAFTSYRNQTMDVKPLNAQAGDTDVTVRTLIRESGRQPIAIDYNLEKTDGGWKVYDVVVAGVSLVTNYRETFAAEVRNSGIDGLIKSLAMRNKTNEGAAAAK